ncbi:MAG: HDIG domain-containing protein, partial [Polyangia bacterium]|nr:HDIG domain-containing protein [Polyangia bacterium]
MIRRRAIITPLGCWLLGVLAAAALFVLAIADLWWTGSSYPLAGQRTTVSYRVPAVGILLELDEKSLYSRGRQDIPAGSRVVEWPPGGKGRRVERFEVRAGDQVEHRDVSFLRALEEYRRPPSVGFMLGLAVLLLGTFVLASHAVRIFVTHGERMRTQLVLFVPLVFLLGVFKLLMVFTPISVFWLPLAALSISWSILHSRLLGVIIGLVGSLSAGALVPMDWALVTTLAAQAIVPPLVMSPLRKRRTTGLSWVAGVGAALVAYAGYQVLIEGALPPADLKDWQRSGLAAILGAGIISPILAQGLRPLLGALLGVLSRARLMTLADLDQPLLRQVSAEAPGTWQHTLSMANMAEVVCNAIGANGTLVRVGAYYHDIGKSLAPKYFAENLKPGERSPHLDMAPEESAAVIFEHVADGLGLAREHGIPFAVQEFISTHHGDGLLEFFWHKCQEEGNPRSLPEETFRYPGFPPQSREAAVLALVDAAEAAAKSIKDPTAEQIDDLVRRIIFAKLDNRQLDESGLTAPELATVAATLREILRSQFHVRPEYPWQKMARQESSAALQAPLEDNAAPPDPVSADPVSPQSPVEARGAEVSSGANVDDRPLPPQPAPGVEAGARGAPSDSLEPAPSEVLSMALQGDATGPRPRLDEPALRARARRAGDPPEEAPPEDLLDPDTVR